MDLFLSADVEADGPIPGPYSMSAIGVCAAGTFDGTRFTALDVDAHTFYSELKPISDAFDPAAAAVSGLDRDRLIASAPAPEQAMRALSDWVTATARAFGARPVFVGYPLGFDWMWASWYLVRFTGSSPFGHSGHLDAKTMYARAAGVRLGKAALREVPAELRGSRPHTHHALEDAQAQGELFANLWQWAGPQRAGSGQDS